MKLSVILGVVQMTIGICMGLFNHIHYRKWMNIIFEFIPQVFFIFFNHISNFLKILFMSLIFGYLVLLIFIKWAIPLRNEPYLINVLIDIFLSFGSLPAEENIYNGQVVLCVNYH